MKKSRVHACTLNYLFCYLSCSNEIKTNEKLEVMKKQERVLANIQSNKEIQKGISKLNYYSEERFIQDASLYIKAIKEGRMICSIPHVSKSGMSINIKFLECAKRYKSNTYNYNNFFAFFKALGFTEARQKDHSFTVGGCGMDMVFHTNYTIIHRLFSLGFINYYQCESLAQMTPTVI